MGNRRAALGAEEAVDGFAGAALAGPCLDGAIDGQLGLGHDGDQGWNKVSTEFLVGRASACVQ